MLAVRFHQRSYTMELLANVTDPRIPLSILMLQLGFKRPKAARPERIAPARVMRFEIPPPAREIYEEPERWDGLS